MPNVKLPRIHPNSLTWDKSAQAMRHGLIHTIAELQAALDDAHDALMQARQESYFVREYLDEARDWIKTILEEAAASPNTLEEWRDGLCRGSIEAVMTKCKAALSELPQGSEVVFTVRRRLAEAEKDGIEPSTERLTGEDQLTADTTQPAAAQADAESERGASGEQKSKEHPRRS